MRESREREREVGIARPEFPYLPFTGQHFQALPGSFMYHQ